jgi:hypothetical protein
MIVFNFHSLTTMKKIIVYIFLSFILISSPGLSKAQTQEPEKSRIETIDGNEFIGIILEKNTETIKIKTDNLGEITIKASDIKKIDSITQKMIKNGTYWIDNPQSTRYFWTPNGYNLKAGEGYYQNVWIMFNQAVYGFTDNFSAGIGTIPLFLFGGTSTPAWITLKYSVPVVKDKINLGAGALMGTVVGDGGFGGILYGISTFGSKDKNMTLGLGYAFGGGKIASTPLINVSGIIRTGANGYLITENYLVIDSGSAAGVMMVGGRRIIRHFGLDFGLGIPFGSGINSFFAFPWLGFTVPFGAKTTVVK